MIFSKLRKEDANKLLKYYENGKTRICDYTVCTALMWRKYYNTEYSITHDNLILKLSSGGEQYFDFPCGEGDIKKTLCEIYDYCKNNGLPVNLCNITAEQLPVLYGIFGKSNITVFFDRDWFDYLYSADDLANFSGKKYSGQRNHINKFSKTYGNPVYRDINEKNIGQVRSFCTDFIDARNDDSKTAVAEAEGLLELFSYYFDTNSIGGFIEVEGKIVAVDIGEIIGDTLFVHIEKALTEYAGSYQVIVREFVRRYIDKIKYVNREEDCGIPGLRTSKLSYHPISLIEKYNMQIN